MHWVTSNRVAFVRGRDKSLPGLEQVARFRRKVRPCRLPRGHWTATSAVAVRFRLYERSEVSRTLKVGQAW